MENKITNNKYIYLLCTVSFVCFIYLFSLNRQWQPFDENFIYKEEFFPIPQSFKEIFEVIKNFVLNHHMVSMNSFFSNHITIRSNLTTSTIIVFISFFLKKSAFLYHLLQLFIHLINTALVWIVFFHASSLFNNSKPKLLIISLLTSIWAIHSVNTEAVLLVTNWTTLLAYTFCLSFILYEISSLQKIQKNQILKFVLISTIFILLIHLTEYGYLLPFIIFFIVLAFSYKQLSSFSIAFKFSLLRMLPYTTGLFIVFIISTLKTNSAFLNALSSNQSSFYVFLERNLWLTPQIFIHYLKILLFPAVLSVYQSNLVHISNSLFNSYSIFCTLTYLLFLLMPLFLFIAFRKKAWSYMFFLIYAFYFGITPFLHIISANYCLCADRYCYFPLFLLLFFFLNIIFCVLNKINYKALTISLLCITLILSFRTLIRIQDWQNPISFYKSALKAETKYLYKGHKLFVFADYINSQKDKIGLETFLQDSLNNLVKAQKEITSLKEKNPSQPITLKLYGLNYDSLLLKAAYCIALIKKNYIQEPLANIASYLEPHIINNLDTAAPNEIAFYADLLYKDKQFEKAKNIYELAYKKYPNILEISLPLGDYYLNIEKDFEKSLKIYKQASEFYPNKGMPMYNLLKYYEQKNDLQNQAKYAYLLGLREHSLISYQHATEIYLQLKQLKEAQKSLEKAIKLKSNDVLTFLQLSKFLELKGNKDKSLEILKNAYTLNNTQPETKDLNLTKSILVNLININYQLGNIEDTKKYIAELSSIKELTLNDRRQILEFRKRLEQGNG